jgi:hypothetical protein
MPGREQLGYTLAELEQRGVVDEVDEFEPDGTDLGEAPSGPVGPEPEPESDWIGPGGPADDSVP